ncbi:MAG: hypothetical protein LBC09_06175 [Helicobacteraceae bacterium]|jgi:hypothetical protein|nr:hypothetical protein [Helicobacteraceae bacterium]
MRVLASLLFIVSIVSAEEFIVAYRQASANHAALNEKLTIAKAMVAFKSSRVKYGFDLEISPQEGKLGAARLLRLYQDDLLENLLKNGVLLTDAAKYGRNGADSKTVLTLPPTRIGAFVKEDMVTIVVYENSDR